MSNLNEETDSIALNNDAAENTTQISYISTSLHDFYHTNISSTENINNNHSSPTSTIHHPQNQIPNNIINDHNSPTNTHTETNWEQNSKDNVAYGDSIEHKAEGVMRIYYQNLHGIKKSNTWHDLKYSVPILHTWGVDIMGFSETNVNWNSKEENAIKAIYKDSYKHSIISTSNSSEISNSSYQQGGTATIITDNFTGRVTSNLSDTTGLGRWSGYRLCCSKTQHLSIITAYCPIVDSKYDTGTCYQQQWRILNQDKTSWEEPRKIMLRDLQTLLIDLIEQQDEILLLWDANNTIHSNELSSLLAHIKLHDLMPETPSRFSTYMRGSRIIDHAWGTSKLKQSTIQAGYLPFNGKAWLSDHRGLYIDIRVSKLFANKIYDIPSKPQRTLTCNNKKAIKQFLDHIEHQQIIDQLLEQSNTLRNTTTWNAHYTTELEIIDSTITKLFIEAEQSLKSNSNLPWSPEMHNLFLIYTYWRKYNSGKKNRVKLDKEMADIIQKIGIGIYMGYKYRHPQKQLRLAMHRWLKIQDDAFQARQQHLYERQELAIKAKNPDEAKIIANLRRCERRKRTYNHIETINKPNKANGGLSYILIKDTTGHLTRIDDIEEMNTLLYHRNRIHFAQAFNTPCTTPEVIRHIGVSGTTCTAQQMLKGVIPDDLPNELKLLFRELNANMQPIELDFTFEDMIDGFAHWKEQTTTSPSGRHLSFYKALVNAHRCKLKTTVEEALEEQAKMNGTPSPFATKHLLNTNILQIINNVINIAVKHSIVIPRWTTVHNFFLEKIPGQPLIDKLRVIHIFEADYNLILKHYISRLTLRNAVKHNIIAHEQAGGRPHRTAIDEAVRTTITYEICKLQRHQGGVMYNDAKACFDRVIENISNLTCLNAGTPIEVCNLHSNTLHNMKYIIKHKFGLSPHINGHMNPDPFYGIGQGAGDSTTRWGFISDAIIKCYNRYSHAAKIKSPISLIYSDNRVQAFVDDSRLFIICTNAEGIDIYNSLKSDVELWQKLLHATGAKLELEKCKFFVFTWTFDIDGNPHLTQLQQPHQMQIQDSETQETTNVNSMNITDSYKLLGVQISFTGNNDDQVKVLTTNVQHLIKVFHKVTLSHDDTLLGYNTVAIPKLHYPLPATSIPTHILRKMQDKLTYNILPRIGYNRSFPRAIVHAPKYFGGLAFHDLAAQQSISKITSILGHYRAKTSLSIQYTQLIEAYIINSGLGQSPLEFPQRISYVKSSWLDISIELLLKINAHIKLQPVQTIPFIREQDDYIMKLANQWTSITDTLHYINQCRRHLQVTTISEITNSYGTHILDWIANPTIENVAIFKTYSRSKLEWPNQVYPSQKMWKIWNIFIRSIVKPTTNTMLKVPLGKWFDNYKTQRDWTYISDVDFIIETGTPHTTTLWHSCNRTKTIITYQHDSELALPTEFFNTAVPIFPTSSKDQLTIAITHRHRFINHELLCPYYDNTTIEHITTNHTHPNELHNTPSDVSKYLQYAHTISTESFNHLLAAPTIYITIGYSLQLNNISSGWTISTESTLLYTGKLLHANASTNSKLRALAIGTIASIYHYMTLYNTTNCPKPDQQIIICTKDNILYNQVTHWKYNMPTAAKQFYNEQENINVLKELLTNSITRYSFSIPKDHDILLQQQLSDFINISNRHAYNAVSMCHEFRNPITPLHQATIYINNIEINATILLELNNAIHTPDLRIYFHHKYNWDSKTIHLIDWEAHNQAIKNFRSTQRKTLLQFIHKWLPTNSHPASMKPLTPLCTVCNINNETNDHFIECTHQSYRVAWEADVLTWHEKVKALQLEPILCYYIIIALNNWRTFDSIDNIEFCEGIYKKLYLEQTTIGWQQVLFGRLTKTWIDIQNDYLQESTSKGLEIISTSITLLFKIVLNRWKTRCHHQHGKCAPSNDNLREHVLFPKVRQLYADSEQLTTNKRQYFNISIENILQKPTKALKQWITRTDKYLHNILQQEIISSTSDMQPLTQFFQPRKQRNQPKQKQKAKPKSKQTLTEISQPEKSFTPNQEDFPLDNLPVSNIKPPTINTIKLKSTPVNNIIKRKTQSVRRRFTQAKRKNQPKRKKPSATNKNKNNEHHTMPRPPPEPDPPNIEEELFNLLNQPP